MASKADYSLTSINTMVESPFLYITVGGYTFGKADKRYEGHTLKIDFPNFMDKIEITKTNGELNTYVISMTYAIQAGDDPNIIDHIFSQASGNREIIISYGDWSHPQHIYKEEKALITNLTQNFSFSSSKITYNIAAVSSSLNLMSQSFNFPAVMDKPSNIIRRLLMQNQYKLREVFKGMNSMSAVISNNLIASDDKVVQIENKNMMNVLDYMIYLTECMQPESGDGFYAFSISDDTKTEMGGSYFQVKKVNVASWEEEDAYELDIGFPGNNLVSEFSVGSNQQWSILYEASADSQLKTFYTIDKFGQMIEEPSVPITRDKEHLKTTSYDTAWWKKMTEYPISVSVTIKGLARPTILLQYIKLNVLFYGVRHSLSGRYIITKQIDTIDGGGYKTQLEMLRIKGDDISTPTKGGGARR